MKTASLIVLSLGSLLAACGKSDDGPITDQFGKVWHEREAQWTGTWTRKGNSKTFTAEWKEPGGQVVKDELTLESGTSNQVVLLRKGVNGRYRGQLSNDGTKIENGTADWLKGGWSATIEK